MLCKVQLSYPPWGRVHLGGRFNVFTLSWLHRVIAMPYVGVEKRFGEHSSDKQGAPIPCCCIFFTGYVLPLLPFVTPPFMLEHLFFSTGGCSHVARGQVLSLHWDRGGEVPNLLWLSILVLQRYRPRLFDRGVFMVREHCFVFGPARIAPWGSINVLFGTQLGNEGLVVISRPSSVHTPSPTQPRS